MKTIVVIYMKIYSTSKVKFTNCSSKENFKYNVHIKLRFLIFVKYWQNYMKVYYIPSI